MDGFSYSDIFATKGIEYLVIIAFLALLVPFSVLINRRVKITRRIKHALGMISAGTLKIPQGLFFNKNHTWTHLEKSGAASVGLDDLLVHLTGEVTLNTHRVPGEIISKGDLITEINHGGKLLKIFSPVSGRILRINTIIQDEPGILNTDPYGKGWILEIQPSDWVGDTRACYIAEQATSWLKGELERVKDFMALTTRKFSPEASMVILQDGGELSDHTLSMLPDEIWQEFQKEFLDP
jgi:glycine cleavage system H protein